MQQPRQQPGRSFVNRYPAGSGGHRGKDNLNLPQTHIGCQHMRPVCTGQKGIPKGKTKLPASAWRERHVALLHQLLELAKRKLRVVFHKANVR